MFESVTALVDEYADLETRLADPAVHTSVCVWIAPSLSATEPGPASKTRVLSRNSTPRAAIRSCA